VDFCQPLTESSAAATDRASFAVMARNMTVVTVRCRRSHRVDVQRCHFRTIRLSQT